VTIEENVQSQFYYFTNSVLLFPPSFNLHFISLNILHGIRVFA